MAKLDIIEAPDPRLTRRSVAVERVDADLLLLLDDMLETMYAAPGIGLAAPQVGVLVRAFVADLGEDGKPQPLFAINPEIVWRSPSATTMEEGCLSLPGQFGDVARADRVRMRFWDREGAVQEIEAEGLFARCLQHEIDHLNGVLFIDHLSALKRTLILRRLAKSKRSKTRATA